MKDHHHHPIKTKEKKIKASFRFNKTQLRKLR